MAKGILGDYGLPIDDRPEGPLPLTVPLARTEIKHFLYDYRRFLKSMETWARIHLSALACHPDSPTPNMDNLIDDLSEESLEESKERVLSQFRTPHHHENEMPIDYQDFSDVDEEGVPEDEMRLLEPSRKKKSLFRRVLVFKRRKRDPSPRGATRDPSPRGATRDPSPRGATRDPSPRGATRDPSPRGATRDPSPRGATRDPSPRGATTRNMEKAEAELEEERVRMFQDLKQSYAEILNKEVEKYKGKSKRDPPTEVREATTHTFWIEEMVHRIHVCQMALKTLGDVKKNTDALMVFCSFDGSAPDGIHFKTEESWFLRNRMAYLGTMRVLLLILVKDSEDIQLNSDTFHECVERYKRVRAHQQPKFKKVGKTERAIFRCMTENLSVLPELEEDASKHVEEILKTEESKRSLLLSTEEDDTSSSSFQNLGSFPTLDMLSAGVQLGIASPLSSSSATSKDEPLVYEVKVAAGSDKDLCPNLLKLASAMVASTSRSSIQGSLLLQSPAPVEFQNPLAVAAAGSSGEQEAVEPMQESPPESKPPSDEDTSSSGSKDLKRRFEDL